ncbi:Polyketide cyclase / dehydrase and lipid transport [Nocardioides scoriae]|uniref:Polyketide cyclase / dehydrase and lipid transport n=1 Tax=Nocardioides scoriae TaxID=642780 RepID=A0A1H1V5I2_9ACTN|nr:SRPBCC family protein [Nocardioides scoriae]SDS79998.1 Polyketide cyclase / dehydrase and lipid transport [Nocardioides scoriae]
MSDLTAWAASSLSGSRVVAADPTTVGALVSDVTRTGEWSPVCAAAWWEDDVAPGPRAGAWFGGRNQVPGRTWETRSLVLDAEPGRTFRWQVEGRYATWGYALRPVETSGAVHTELTETYELGGATVARFEELYADRAAEVLDARCREAREGIPATLAALARILEG